MNCTDALRAMKDFLERHQWILTACYLFTSVASVILSWTFYTLHLVHLIFPIVGTVMFTGFFILIFFISLHRNRTDRISAFIAQEVEIERIAMPYLKLTQQELAIATSNFSNEAIIGKGRFGTVYRGILPSGQIVAIKRIELQDPFSQSHFFSELRILGQLRHRNLLKILGYFFNNKEMLIISKFMANLSLDVLLHGPSNCRLDWKQRLNIAVGVAHGLAYLHHECRNTIVHCDLKPGNILLDEYMEAHIADFGVAKIMNNNQFTESSLGPRFTVGYTAPERAYQVRPSARADVYSFGIVLLELMSGLNPTSSKFIDMGMTLPQWINKEYSENGIKYLIDDCLKSETQFHNEMETVIRIGILCSTESPKLRPEMNDVVKGLVRITGERQFNVPIYELAEERNIRHASEITTETSASSAV